MHRLFVAIRPPGAIRSQLLDVMHGVRGARWQDEDQLHLTLRFIGEVDRHRAEDAAAALGSIHHPPFAIALNGIGSFDGRGKGTLWAGVTPHDQLKALHKKVDQACFRVGIAPDTRAYLPHITLARLKPAAGPIDALVEVSGGLRSEPFPVDAFCLYESDLCPSGPIYSIVERYPLDRHAC
ncbi:MAG TPA: RNA 2',3'-cyclic phosphodiesterase [Allosphingosinicella sp.]|nr:RNA 2',3'-cyclic phosphodiesterase [Allosphingosinicella sp.]